MPPILRHGDMPAFLFFTVLTAVIVNHAFR